MDPGKIGAGIVSRGLGTFFDISGQKLIEEGLQGEHREVDVGKIVFGTLSRGLGTFFDIVGKSLIKEGVQQKFHQVECPICGTIISWPEGQHQRYCPYCRNLLELK